MSRPTSTAPYSRRTVLRSLAALTAATALPGARQALATSTPALNILNSNTLWAEALTGAVAKAYGAAAVTGESNPYEAHYEKLLIELSQG